MAETGATLAAEVPSVAECAGLLADLANQVVAADRTARRIVDAVGVALRSSACETIEGLPVELWLTDVCRVPAGEAWFYRQAADVLAHLPATDGLWRRGVLCWGQVRKIVARARKLNRDLRAQLDGRIGASADRFEHMDPDHVVDAVEAAADELEGAAKAQRTERRVVEAEFVSVQPDFLGGVKLYGEFGPVSGAIVTNALDRRSAQTTHTETEPGEPTSRGKANAAALISMCADDLSGNNDGGPARPLLLVGVQLSDVTATAAGMVELDVPGLLPTLTARTVDALAEDADLRAVIFDGATPLAASGLLHAKDIPTRTRAAVWLRDRACRFPGSRRPATGAHVHHMVHRADGGDHHPDNLITLSDSMHRLVHDHDWKLSLDPTDGTVTAHRGDRTLTSLPPTVGLRNNDTPDDEGEERAPP